MLVCNNSRHHGAHAAHKSELQTTELLAQFILQTTLDYS